MRGLALLLLFACALPAAEERLTKIHALLVPMRGTAFTKSRGATPTLTEVKHQLREWFEFRLPAVQWKDTGWTISPSALQEQLNDELSRADLFCQTAECTGSLGYLEKIQMETQDGFLVVRTTVGIQECGADDSAYIYQPANNGWNRVWQSEQNNYNEKAYAPQRLTDVKISLTDWSSKADRTERLIVTVGTLPACVSVFHPLFYRVWQTKTGYTDSRLLLDKYEYADIGEGIHTRVTRNDVFIEFRVIASDAMRMREIKHYRLENGKLQREDPVALTPQEFVSFWLRDAWNEASEWTNPSVRSSLKAEHEQYKGTDSEFIQPTLHCAGQPDLWQVITDPVADDPPVVHYFLIRARPPFRFTMVGMSEHPYPDCKQFDPAIDDPPELFDQ